MKTYTITQARQLLNVDNKTFSRWLERADIAPQPSKHDERVKRITEEQLQLLASIHERPIGQLPVEREVHPTVKTLQKRQEALEHTVASLSEQVTKIEAALLIVTEQLTKLTTAQDELLTLTEGLGVRLSELEAQLHDARVVYLSKLLEYDPEQLKILTARLEAVESRLAAQPTRPSKPAPASRVPPAQQHDQATTAQPQQGVASGSSEGLVSAVQFAERHGVRKEAAQTAFKRQAIPTTKRQGDIAHYLTKEQQRAALTYWEEHKTSGFQPCSDPDCLCHTHPVMQPIA